jgi:large subunit ribosomal protein L18e
MFMKSNVERSDIRDWIAKLSSVKRGEKNYALSMRVAKLVSLPRRSRLSVTVYKINKFTKEGETVLVPGKVLHRGTMQHKVNIAAVSYSEKAKAAIHASGSSMIGLQDALKSKGVRIIT